ncbi:isopenicillin N synthase family oxygenase, partial [Mesorhizobium sp. M5C.F.Ca.ET.164.01.1.1]|uniref:isopenicillin N synthase family oxygenase n=1 Tax=Mesorhizobium sp. M5C.F.Ca.ET.164.01.1.1 TaxID=2563957 RepID=UPI001AEF0667
IPIHGTFVINIGDLIQRLTNNLYLANMHRVVNSSGRERYSMPSLLMPISTRSSNHCPRVLRTATRFVISR